MRGLPGITILQPADHVTTVGAVRWAAKHDGPVYLRLTRQKLPSLYRNDQAFQAGRGIILKEGGKKLALVASGGTVGEILKASEELSEVNPWVVDMHTIKPIDRALIKSLARSVETIVTVEDHNIIGGLGTAIAEVLAEDPTPTRLLRIGVQDTYGESGTATDLYEKYGLSAHKVVEKVRSSLKL
jgi:transketolase